MWGGVRVPLTRIILFCFVLFPSPILISGFKFNPFKCMFNFKFKDSCTGNWVHSHVVFDHKYIKAGCCKTLNELNGDCVPGFLHSISPIRNRWVEKQCKKFGPGHWKHPRLVTVEKTGERKITGINKKYFDCCISNTSKKLIISPYILPYNVLLIDVPKPSKLVSYSLAHVF